MPRPTGENRRRRDLLGPMQQTLKQRQTQFKSDGNQPKTRLDNEEKNNQDPQKMTARSKPIRLESNDEKDLN